MASEMVRNAVRKFSLGRALSLWAIWAAASAWNDTCITVQCHCNHSLGIGGAKAYDSWYS